MVHIIRCIRSLLLLVLLGLLFVLNALRDYSCAHAHHQDWDMDKNNKIVVNEDNNFVSAQKELLDGFTTTGTRKFGLGGRKMVVHDEVLRKGEIEKDELMNFHRSSNSEDISGDRQINALVKSLQGSQDQYLNNQKLGYSGTPRSEAVHLPDTKSPKHSHQESKKLPTEVSVETFSRSEKPPSHLHKPQPPQATIEKGETQVLLEATREIVNLMNKDYTGMDRPRRKPPINNHVPIH